MSWITTLLGHDAEDAANKAAADTYYKQQQAVQGIQNYGATLPGAYSALSQGYSPYTQAGGDALTRLMEGLGLSGNGQDFTNAYQNLPGYQSGLNTGLTSAQRALNAGHIGQSGAALKQLYRYGSDYENQRAGDYLSRLGGLAASGLNATGSQIGTQAQGLAGNTAAQTAAFGGNLQSAPTIGQGIVAGAQAQQQGITNLLNTAAYLGGKLIGSGGGGGGGGGGGMFGGLSGLMGGGAGAGMDLAGAGNAGWFAPLSSGEFLGGAGAAAALV